MSTSDELAGQIYVIAMADWVAHGSKMKEGALAEAAAKCLLAARIFVEVVEANPEPPKFSTSGTVPVTVDPQAQQIMPEGIKRKSELN